MFGLTISLGIAGKLSVGGVNALPLPLIFLALAALWNGFVSLLAIYNGRLRWHRQINVGLDLFFSLIFFIVSGETNSAVFWISLLPLFSGAIYYGARGAILVAVINSLIQTGTSYLVAGRQVKLDSIEILTGFNLITGVIVALLSAPLLRRLRRSYQSTVNMRRESERKAQRQEHERMRALFSMIETFSATLNYQTVLVTMLDTAIAALGEGSGKADGMVGCVLLFSDHHNLVIQAARGFIPRDNAIDLPAEQGALHEALRHGETQLVKMPGEDPELCKLATVQERKSALCLPLIRGMTAFGVMVFAHENPDFFTAERLETLQMLGNQAVIAVQNARLYQELAREKERIVQTQEEAQKKLARDLHDGPTQSISAIAMRINIARKMLEKAANDPVVSEASTELARIEDLARRTTQEIRHMLFTLRPLVLESEGLEAALKTIADKMSDLYQQKVVLDINPLAVQQMDANIQTVTFYLAEETVNNARKYAQATEIWVRIQFPPNENSIAVLEVADNGCGFDVESVMNSYDRRGSLGMINLQERTDLINGLLKIDSVQGKGTRVRVFIPLNEEATDRLHQLR